ncbi:MAG: hypothetical protein HGA46_08665 [Chlorobiaceae bacterium]|nr:hypothetical protein [Chlorobiaceae bacterium]
MMVFFALLVSTGCSVGAVALADEKGVPGGEHAIWFVIVALLCFLCFTVLWFRHKKKQVE